MTLRTRIAVIAAAAVAAALLVGSVGLYLVTARSLLQPIDRSLVELTRSPRRDGPTPGPRPGTSFGGAGGYVQLVGEQGQVLSPRGADRLPVDDRTIHVAAGDGQPFFSTVQIGGHPVRVYTTRLRPGVAVQAARPLSEVNETLARVRRRLLTGSLLGVALAGGLGLVVARRAVGPVDELTALAEEVSATNDLSRRIDVAGDDELARLATTFNRMLANLEQARTAQEQLVADASHELRTPLTSLRTNVEVLTDIDRLEPAQRRALLDDVVAQLDEFGRLVGALVELARGDQPARGVATVRLDELVAATVERSATFTPPDRPIVTQLAPCTVRVEPDRIERAVSNLIDNAVKYGEGPVEVAVADGAVTVADRGPGVAPQDRARVFERFYRAAEARSEPGSGLGLSIVAQAAEAHGGSVSVGERPGGGAVFTLRLPTFEAHATDES